MAVPPLIVATARDGWRWQWRQLMQGLGPADAEGRYVRPPSDRLAVTLPDAAALAQRSPQQRPRLVVGRSCPWAHRTWLMHSLRHLAGSLDLWMATADHRGGRWTLEPAWMGCSTLVALYRHCGTPPHHRATVPALIDPGEQANSPASLLGNDSAALTAALNRWPGGDGAPDLAPDDCNEAIDQWQALLQSAVNDGVYRCGFARSQRAYDDASAALFQALEAVEHSLEHQGPWLCGDQLTLADVRLFPTLIRWELVYAPLFGCSAQPLWRFPALWRWRQRFYALPGVARTCDGDAWRHDYFGALFPLNPGGIVPAGPELSTLVQGAAAQP
ncbi:MAG: glutathione S-transferase C-terminal domain-containing protein [Synechococcus sp.]